MSQNDLNIANQSATNFRSDLNSALQALGSTNSGSSAPSTTYANMLFYDTSANILRIRNEADSAWIDLGFVDQGSGKFSLLDDTKVVDTSGTQTGLLGDQPTATWESGLGTTDSLISPAKVKAAVYALAPSVGSGQTWANFTRARGTSFRNTTGNNIQVVCQLITSSRSSGGQNFFGTATFQVSSNNSTWVTMISANSQLLSGSNTVSAVIPDNYYYKWTGDDDGDSETRASATFTELR